MFHSTNATIPNVLFGYKVSNSLVGKCIPIVYGRRRIAGNVIWIGAWDAVPVSGGKGNKGKGGTQQFNYICALLIGIGQGPVSGVYGIWLDRDQYNLAYSTEYSQGASSYQAVNGGTGNPYWWVLNVGVDREDYITHTYNDPGSPGSVTVTGKLVWTPMELVPSSPSAGQYTLAVDGSGYAHYGFAAADVSANKRIEYTYQINNYSTIGDPMTHLNLVLFNGQQGQPAWNGLLDNPYYVGQALGYSELAYIGSLQMQLGSSGVIPNLNFEVQGRCAVGGTIINCNPSDVIKDMLTNPLDGVLGWATTASTTPIYGPQVINGVCNTSGTPVVATTGSFSGINVGGSISIGGVGYTVAAYTDIHNITLGTSSGTNTGEPWQATVYVTYNQASGSSIWLPPDNSTVGLGPSGEVYLYCLANGILVSPLLETQRESREIINELMQIANADCFWSEGLFKFRSYGDTTAIGNGVIYTPNTAPVYDIDDADMICSSGEEPLKLTRPNIQDVCNEVKIDWTNRASAYASSTIYEQDMANVLVYGRHPLKSFSFDCITDQSIASMVGTTLVKRFVYIDGAGTYELTLPPHFARLDPMDIITVTDEYLGMYKVPLRILNIEEDEDLKLKFTLEAFPWSCSGPTIYPKQGSVNTNSGFFVDPGPVIQPMFVPLPSEITQGNEYELGIALCGSQNWGGAVVYISTDGGNSYQQVGIQNGPTNMGALSAVLPYANDPDTTDTLSVNLTISYGSLGSYTKTQADNFASLVSVDQELIAYETATLTGIYGYDLTYLRRGVWGSIVTKHQSGATICAVDAQLFRWYYPASAIGTTIYFKFCSVNKFGQRQMDISNAVAYPYFVAGPKPPYPWNAGYEQPNSGNPLWVQESFGLAQVYGAAANGDPLPQLQVLGNPPLAIPSGLISAPVINSVTVSGSGSIPGGRTYLIALDAADGNSNPNYSSISDVIPITIPSGPSKKVTINVTWGAGSYGGRIYTGFDNDDHGLRYESPTWDLGTSTGGTTVNYDLTSISSIYFGCPDSRFDHFEFDISLEYAGVWANQVTNVDASNLYFNVSGDTPSLWIGSILSKLANNKQSLSTHVGIQDFQVTASDANGKLTVTPSPLGLVSIGDVIVCRTRPTSAGADYVVDSKYSNQFGFGGIPVHQLAGWTAIITAGTGSGDEPRTVLDNDGTRTTVSPPWTNVPDASSVIVYTQPNPQTQSSGNQFRMMNYAGSGSVTFNGQVGLLPVPNYAGSPVRVEVYTADAEGSRAERRLVASRDVYIWGAQGTRIITTSGVTMLPTDLLVEFDTSGITPGTSTTLTANITDTVGTAVSVASGVGLLNTFYFKVDSEYFQVTGGGGTSSLTVTRGALGSVAATHSSGATVSVPGILNFTLLPASQVPNQEILMRKMTTDINVVVITCDASDSFPGGYSHEYLVDTSITGGTSGIKFPGTQ